MDKINKLIKIIRFLKKFNVLIKKWKFLELNEEQFKKISDLSWIDIKNIDDFEKYWYDIKERLLRFIENSWLIKLEKNIENINNIYFYTYLFFDSNNDQIWWFHLPIKWKNINKKILKLMKKNSWWKKIYNDIFISRWSWWGKEDKIIDEDNRFFINYKKEIQDKCNEHKNILKEKLKNVYFEKLLHEDNIEINYEKNKILIFNIKEDFIIDKNKFFKLEQKDLCKIHINIDKFNEKLYLNDFDLILSDKRILEESISIINSFIYKNIIKSLNELNNYINYIKNN